MAKKKNIYTELNTLKGKMREKKVSYKMMSEVLGLAVSTLSNKVNGYQIFTLSEAEQIAIYLDIPPKDFAYYFMPEYNKTYSIYD